jgi:hypothetical protein
MGSPVKPPAIWRVVDIFLAHLHPDAATAGGLRHQESRRINRYRCVACFIAAVSLQKYPWFEQTETGRVIDGGEPVGAVRAVCAVIY